MSRLEPVLGEWCPEKRKNYYLGNKGNYLGTFASICESTWLGRGISIQYTIRNERSLLGKPIQYTTKLNKNSLVNFLNANRLEGERELKPGRLWGWGWGGSSQQSIQDRLDAYVQRKRGELHTTILDIQYPPGGGVNRGKKHIAAALTG